jgi:hypothetical protein
MNIGTLTVLKAHERSQKEQKELAAEQRGLEPVQAGLGPLAALIPSVNSEEFGRGVSQIALAGSPEATDPLIREFTTRVQANPLTDTLEAMGRIRAEQDAAYEREQGLLTTQAESDIGVDAQRQKDANRIAMERTAGIVDKSDSARYEIASNDLAEAMSSGNPRAIAESASRIAASVANPAIEMPIIQAKANAIWAATKDSGAISATYRAQGFNVPPALARAVSEGKDAAIDEFTGLISVDPGERGAEQRQARAQTMISLGEIEAISERIVTGPTRGMNAAQRLKWVAEQAALNQVGNADPLYVEFRRRRDLLEATMARATFTGQMSNQERAFIREQIIETRMLSANKDGSSLSPQSRAALNALYGQVESKYRVAIPRGVFSNEQLRTALDRAKSESKGFFVKYLDERYPIGPDASGWEDAN